MQTNKFIIITLMFLLLIVTTSAWSPPSDMDLFDYYAMYNATEITTENITAENYFGITFEDITVDSNLDINNYSIINASDVNSTRFCAGTTCITNFSNVPLSSGTIADLNVTNSLNVTATNSSFINVFADAITSTFSGIFNWFIKDDSSQYLIFNTTHLSFNETKLNATIDDRDSDSGKNTDGRYLYNDTTTIYFNDTLNNATIDSRAETIDIVYNDVYAIF